jgi:Tfp pilus assembly protein PilP
MLWQVCLEKCALMAEMLLAKRSVGTTASFLVVLKSASKLASEQDLQRFVEQHNASPTTELKKLKVILVVHLAFSYVIEQFP